MMNYPVVFPNLVYPVRPPPKVISKSQPPHLFRKTLRFILLVTNSTTKRRTRQMKSLRSAHIGWIA